MGLGRKPRNVDARLIVSSTVVTKFIVGPQMGGPGSPSSILIRDCYDKDYDGLWQLIAQTQILSLGPQKFQPSSELQIQIFSLRVTQRLQRSASRC